MSEEDKDRQALMMGPLGADKAKDAGAANQPLTPRDQALPILSYCAASIMMTVVNKVSRWPMSWLCTVDLAEV
jgi:GDP-mannose transporter